jgi:hypothetical protein
VDRRAPVVTRLGWLAAAAAGFAMLLGAAFVARAASRDQRTRTALWADHGASRSAALSAFGRAGAESAFIAGAGAVVLALIVAPPVRALAGEPISHMSMIAALSSTDVMIACAAPLLAALAGAAGARAAAARAFDAADRLG